MITVSLQQAIREIKKAEEEFGERKVHAAIRMALNDGIRKGKTEVRRTIQSLYNIKTSRINDPDKKKGLSTRLATNSNLEADLDAGHIPVNLINLVGTKTVTEQTSSNISISKKGKVKAGKKNFSAAGISVEIIKGQRKTITTAFTVGNTRAANGRMISIPGKAVFARGQRGKPDFQFGKERMPIDSISTVSIATAAISVRSQQVYQQTVTDYTLQRLMKQLDRLGSG